MESRYKKEIGQEVSQATPPATQADHVPQFGQTEKALGNPNADGKILSSTVSGVRTWITPPVNYSLTAAKISTALGYDAADAYLLDNVAWSLKVDLSYDTLVTSDTVTDDYFNLDSSMNVGLPHKLLKKTDGSFRLAIREGTEDSLRGAEGVFIRLYDYTSVLDSNLQADQSKKARIGAVETTIASASGDIVVYAIELLGTAWGFVNMNYSGYSFTYWRGVVMPQAIIDALTYTPANDAAVIKGVKKSDGTVLVPDVSRVVTLPAELGLGETISTAYRGDRGKIAYDHSQAPHAPTNAQKNSDITKLEIEAKLIGAITSHTHPAAQITESTTKRFASDTEKAAWNAKQAALVSGSNIKTINGVSLLGAGDFAIASSRAAKTVAVTTQYTVVAEDYVSKRLIFTANAGEAINVIINSGVAPSVDAELQIVSAGNHILNFTTGGVATLTPTKDCIASTVGIGSVVTVVAETTVNDFVIAGSLQYSGELSSSRPIKTINTTSYTLVLEDRFAWLRFTSGVATTVTVPNALFSAKDEILGDVSGAGDVTFVAGAGAAIKKVVSRTTTYPTDGVIGGKFRTASELLIFGSLKPL